MRTVNETLDTLHRALGAARDNDKLAEDLDVLARVERLIELTNVNQPFSKAARAALALQGASDFCARPEHAPAVA